MKGGDVRRPLAYCGECVHMIRNDGKRSFGYCELKPGIESIRQAERACTLFEEGEAQMMIGKELAFPNCLVDSVHGCSKELRKVNGCANCGNNKSVYKARIKRIRSEGLTIVGKDVVTGKEFRGLKLPKRTEE